MLFPRLHSQNHKLSCADKQICVPVHILAAAQVLCLCLAHMLLAMKARLPLRLLVVQSGLIINIGSVASLHPRPKNAVYATSKCGLRGWESKLL